MLLHDVGVKFDFGEACVQHRNQTYGRNMLHPFGQGLRFLFPASLSPRPGPAARERAVVGELLLRKRARPRLARRMAGDRSPHLTTGETTDSLYNRFFVFLFATIGYDFDGQAGLSLQLSNLECQNVISDDLNFGAHNNLQGRLFSFRLPSKYSDFIFPISSSFPC